MIRQYSILVEFLGHALGPDYEIALHDLGRKQPAVVAIAHGKISGRTIGAPLTNVAMQLISEKAYVTQNWKLNYRGVSADGKILRCCTFFIKDEKGALTGLLCINFDDSRYHALSKQVFALCHPDEYAARNIVIDAVPLKHGMPEQSGEELFYNSIASATEDALSSVLNHTDVPPERLTQSEKLGVIQVLAQKGIFMLKGTIPIVAKKLACSQASIYRYLSKINQDKNQKCNGTGN